VIFLLFLWQLPQNLLALCMLFYFHLTHSIKQITKLHGKTIIHSSKAPNGISLGNFVFVKYPSNQAIIKHELGHCRQSEILGWLYLPIVGLPSITMNIISRYNASFAKGYYRRFPENWADRLAKDIISTPSSTT